MKKSFIPLIPALDILDSEVVRLYQGDYNQKKVYSSKPVETALRFAEAGVSHLHLVDLSGARSGEIVHHKLFGEIKRATGCSIEVGGGIRSLRDVEKLQEEGIDTPDDQFMIGSLPFKNSNEFKKIQGRLDSRILLTVDVWGREVKISGWQEGTRKLVSPFMNEMKEMGVSNFLVTQIMRDGTMEGPDVELYKELDQFQPDVSVIVSGGFSNLTDLDGLKDIQNLKGIILGKAFYEGVITLENIKEHLSG